MVNENSKKPITLRGMVECCLWLWLSFIAGSYIYFRVTGTLAVDPVGNWLAFLTYPAYTYSITFFIFVVLALAYILAEPKEVKLLTALSRAFLVLGFVYWICLGILAYITFSFSSACIGNVIIASTFPLTIFLSYLVLGIFKSRAWVRGGFTTLCLVLPIAHMLISIRHLLF